MRATKLRMFIDGVTRPPRYPPWFSVGLIAPVLLFSRGELGTAVLPVDAPLRRLLDPAVFVVPNSRVPWLAEVRLRQAGSTGGVEAS